MNDGKALLRGVLESPSEDAPRLVYADWLEEHDQSSYAVFIRDQIAHRPVRLGSVDFRQWFNPWFDYDLRFYYRKKSATVVVTQRYWVDETIHHSAFVRRGFINYIFIPADHWIHYADVILSLQPIETVVLTNYLTMSATIMERVRTWRNINPSPGSNLMDVLRAEWPCVQFIGL